MTGHDDVTDSGPENHGLPLLFDMDGVVLEGVGTDPVVYEMATDAALAEFGADPTDDQRSVLRSHGCDEETAAACEALGIDLAAYWRRREGHASRIAERRLREGSKGTCDDVEAIRSLTDGRPAALVSNNRQETVAFVAELFDLADAFEVARGREPTPEGYRRRKPDPFYLEAALADLGIEPGRAGDGGCGLYVGDREKDVLAARRAGLDAVLVRRPHNRDVSPEPAPGFEVDSLWELDGVLRDVESGADTDVE